MMNHCIKIFTIAVTSLFLVVNLYAEDIQSAGAGLTPIKGNWSDTATWWGGILPQAGDNVFIVDGDTVTIDVPIITVGDITVGNGVSGALIFSSSVVVKLTVTGNLLVNEGGTFRNTGGASGAVIDTMWIYGDFINNGPSLDMRTGSNPWYGTTCVIFTGPNNSAFSSPAPYVDDANEFNAITIDKSGSGRVILGSNIYMAGGNSTVVASQPFLHLKHGILQTGQYTLITRSTAANTSNPILIGGSSESYIIGWYGRGMSSSSTATRFFPVGDEDGYRPISIRNVSPGGATGHNIRVRVIRGNANPTSSSPSGGIDKVSTARYYEIKYDATDVGTQPTMSLDKFSPSYHQQDGVTAGNSNLRVGYTTDNLINWKGMEQIAVQDTTKYTDPPSQWRADSLPTGSYVTLTSGGSSAFAALARATGTSENSLDFTTNDVKSSDELPESFSLSQNYPNPFNPATTFEYSIVKNSRVTVDIVNSLGQTVARLVDGERTAGTYTVEFNASTFSSGMYFYRLITGMEVVTKKMILAK